MLQQLQHYPSRTFGPMMPVPAAPGGYQQWGPPMTAAPPQPVFGPQSYNLIEAFVKVLCDGIAQGLFRLDTSKHKRFLDLAAFRNTAYIFFLDLKTQHENVRRSVDITQYEDRMKTRETDTGEEKYYFEGKRKLRRDLFNDWAETMTNNDSRYLMGMRLRPLLEALLKDLFSFTRCFGIDYYAAILPDVAKELDISTQAVDKDRYIQDIDKNHRRIEDSKAILKALAMYFGINISIATREGESSRGLVPDKILRKKSSKRVRRNVARLRDHLYFKDYVTIESYGSENQREARQEHVSMHAVVPETPHYPSSSPAAAPTSFLGFPKQGERHQRNL